MIYLSAAFVGDGGIEGAVLLLPEVANIWFLGRRFLILKLSGIRGFSFLFFVVRSV